MSNLVIPKSFVKGIRIPDHYPMGGQLAQPCLCGYPTDPETQRCHLIGWHDGRLMFVHIECVPSPDA